MTRASPACRVPVRHLRVDQVAEFAATEPDIRDGDALLAAIVERWPDVTLAEYERLDWDQAIARSLIGHLVGVTEEHLSKI